MGYLKNEGEAISPEELDDFLQLLVGDDAKTALKQKITADEFAENILGFEEVEEGDDEEEIAEGEQYDEGEPGMNTGMRGIDPIPEEEGF